MGVCASTKITNNLWVNEYIVFKCSKQIFVMGLNSPRIKNNRNIFIAVNEFIRVQNCYEGYIFKVSKEILSHKFFKIEDEP